MKTKLAIYIMATLTLLTQTHGQSAGIAAAATKVARPTYALILENCALKRTLTGTDYQAIYCILPPTYFVELIDPPQTEPEPNQLLAARYKEIEGYVVASTVEIVSYLPVTAYPSTGTATVDNDGLGLNMRKTPTKSGEIIASIAEDTQLTLIGEIEGEERKAGLGTLWHFVKHADEYGYVYSADVTIKSIEPNIIAAQPEPETPTAPIPEPSLKPAVETILIIALILPTILIVTLLFHRPKKSSKYTN